jgi:hypothetical protein
LVFLSWRARQFSQRRNFKHGDGVLTLPDRKGLEFVIAEVARTNPKAKGQTPESLRLLDPSVLDEIKRSGFVEKVKNQ